MNHLTMVAVYGTVTTIMLALSRVIPALFGSFVIRRSLVVTSAVSFVALAVSLVMATLDLDRRGEVFLLLTWLALFAYHFGLGVLLRLHVRATRFKDYGTFRNLRAMPPVPWFRALWRRRKGDRETYETSPLPSTVSEKRAKYLSGKLGRDGAERPILLLTGSDPARLRRFALRIATELMAEDFDHDANYVCCTTSPEDIWSMFRSCVADGGIDELKDRFVIIDAYTKTFGFRDEVLSERVRQLHVDEKVHIVSNANSAASIHSSTARAFHILKDTARERRRSGRRPCVMIYDTLSVLATSETENELAQFVVHLTAAEMAYDMFTIIVEPDIANRTGVVLDVLRACCGTPIDIDELGDERTIQS